MQEEAGNLEQQNGKTRKSRQERIEELDQRMKQLAERKRKLQAMESQKARKARTRQLIQIGAITVKHFNLPDDIEPADFQRYLQETFPEEH